MLINIGKKSSFRGSKRGRKGEEGGGGGGGKAARLCGGGATKKKAEIGKDGKASVVVV